MVARKVDMNEDATISRRAGRFAAAKREARRDGGIAPYRALLRGSGYHADSTEFVRREAIGLPEGEARAVKRSLEVYQPIRGWGDALVARSTVAARTPARRSASLPWRCLSISVDSDVSNEANDVKIFNAVNKITLDIAFERILCYNHAEKEKNYAA